MRNWVGVMSDVAGGESADGKSSHHTPCDGMRYGAITRRVRTTFVGPQGGDDLATDPEVRTTHVLGFDRSREVERELAELGGVTGGVQ
jgi:hypothetical protein